MSTIQQQIQSTENRYQRCTEQRKERLEHLERLRKGWGADWRKVDEPARVLRRLVSLGQAEAASEAMASIEPRRVQIRRETTTVPDVSLLERILNENNLLGIIFLLKGALVSRAVGRVVIRSRGRVAGFGTGFMVSPRLMMTNNHVLRSETQAAGSTIQFNFFETSPGRPTQGFEFGLRPGVLFRTDRNLDFSLVAVEPRTGELRVESRGWIPLIADSGKAVVGERVNVIQHPSGEPQQVAVHQNQIQDLLDDFLHYSTDTERGSSGSPVLNDQWELAALHHSGVPQRDAQGRILLDDGSIWDFSARDRDRIAWAANEGVRISRIVSHLRAALRNDPERSRLFEQCFEPCPHDFENLRLEGEPEESRNERTGPAASGGPLGPRIDEGGGARWVIPLEVSVDLPGSQATRPEMRSSDPTEPSPAISAPADEPEEPIDEGALALALARLKDHADEPYYDAEKDAEACAAYYPEGLGELAPKELFRSLVRLLEETHEERLGYRKARLEHLYPWVDLRPNRKLASIYSGVSFDPEEVIRLDLEVAAHRESMLRERLAVESLDPEAIEAFLDDLETQMPFNCEHVVPQSWFRKAQPMKADLHHLFTCESGCNSFRSNTPYFDFPDELEEAFRDACGRSEDSRSKFEPAAGKGPAARATLYFLLRYPGLIGDEARELQTERLGVLLKWHEEFQVDEYERHRNAAIFAVQGNRNPLIDLPQLATSINFLLGFGPLENPE